MNTCAPESNPTASGGAPSMGHPAVKRYLALCFLLWSCVGLSTSAAEVEIGELQEIELDISLLWFGCAFRNDTLNVVAHDRFKKAIFHYQIRGGEVFVANRIDASDLYYGLEPFYLSLADNLDLLMRLSDRFYRVSLVTGNELYFCEFDSEDKDREFIDPVDYYANPSKNYFVYYDYRAHEKLVLDFVNPVRQYGKHFLIDLTGNDIKEARMIQKGRTDNRDFQGLLYRDTLYAVWNEIKSNSTVYSKFDGNEWREPVTILNRKDYKDTYLEPIGLYVIDNWFYVFWNNVFSAGGQSRHDVYYQYSLDQMSWSSAVKIEEELRYLSNQEFWSTRCVTDGLLHILVGDASDHLKKRYCTFDGGDWDDHGVVIDGWSAGEKLILDGDENAYVFWITHGVNAMRLFYRKIEQVH